MYENSIQKNVRSNRHRTHAIWTPDRYRWTHLVGIRRNTNPGRTL